MVPFWLETVTAGIVPVELQVLIAVTLGVPAVDVVLMVTA
jgi:hypothetical protein